MTEAEVERIFGCPAGNYAPEYERDTSGFRLIEEIVETDEKEWCTAADFLSASSSLMVVLFTGNLKRPTRRGLQDSWTKSSTASATTPSKEP